jgi:GntR family transcriptional regulator, uxu operon transcriptional repressor
MGGAGHSMVSIGMIGCAGDARPRTRVEQMARSTGDVPALPADRGRRLAETILADSQRAGLGPGSRLPTERQLAADLGATRTSVRRALAVLEAEGRISREVGRGTFLRDARWARAAPDGGGPPGGPDGGRTAEPGAEVVGTEGPDGSTGFAPADVMAIRRMLEPSAMRLVVAWATAADFQEMDRCLAGGEQADSYDEFELWDLALHRCILAASHSPLLARLYAVIDEARHGRFWGDLKRRSASRERQRGYQADHRELVAALRARDADRAVEAMRAHLARVTSHLFDETS